MSQDTPASQTGSPGAPQGKAARLRRAWSWWVRWWREYHAVARRTLVGVLVLVAGVGAVLGLLPQSCEDVFPGEATEAVSLCSSLAVTDVRALLFLLAVALLLLPDVSELKVAGVLDIKRNVEKAAAEAAELREAVGSLTSQVVGVTTLLSTDNRAEASVGDTALHVHVSSQERASETGRAQLVAEDASDALPGPGVAEQAAVRAGFEGLRDQIRVVEAKLVGFTLTGPFTLEIPHSDSRVTPQQLDHATAVVRENFAHAAEDRTTGYWLFTAPVVVAERQLGALAAVVDDTEGVEASLQRPGALSRVHADVQNAANAYGSLLVNLLGEGRILSTKLPPEPFGSSE